MYIKCIINYIILISNDRSNFFHFNIIIVMEKFVSFILFTVHTGTCLRIFSLCTFTSDVCFSRTRTCDYQTKLAVIRFAVLQYFNFVIQWVLFCDRFPWLFNRTSCYPMFSTSVLWLCYTRSRVLRQVPVTIHYNFLSSHVQYFSTVIWLYILFMFRNDGANSAHTYESVLLYLQCSGVIQTRQSKLI